MIKKGHPNELENFYIPEPNSGCWLWLGTMSRCGYGLKAVKSPLGRTSTTTAHRFVYQKLRGPVPAGLELDHKCRTRCCVNPDHLEPVTPAENVHRGLNTKLSPLAVAKIRRVANHARGWKQTGPTHKELAEHYGVSKAAIAHASVGRNWRGENLDG